MKWPLVVVAMLTAAPAIAGWQSAEWGMTVEAVQAKVSSGVQSLAPGSGKTAYTSESHFVRLAGRYRAGQHAFGLSLGFDANGRFGLVELRPDDMSKCWALRADLRDRYGSAHEAPSNAIFEINRWRVPAENNIVELHIMKGASTTCVLKYRPLSTANTRGL